MIIHILLFNIITVRSRADDAGGFSGVHRRRLFSRHPLRLRRFHAPSVSRLYDRHELQETFDDKNIPLTIYDSFRRHSRTNSPLHRLTHSFQFLWISTRLKRMQSVAIEGIRIATTVKKCDLLHAAYIRAHRRALLTISGPPRGLGHFMSKGEEDPFTLLDARHWKGRRLFSRATAAWHDDVPHDL